MGSGRWSPDDWGKYSSSKSYDTKTTAGIFTASKLDPSMSVKGVMRESRDSVDNPKSTPLILALDVTGSMGIIADVIARKGLNTTLAEVYSRKPITDPHCLVMGIGDVEYDTAPVQASQFEADIRLAEQLEKIFLEHGGGGNSFESYAAAWYFAAHHTVTDAFEKRGQKGYLFTIGDEEPTRRLTQSAIKQFFGDDIQADVDIPALLTEVSRKWEVFHIIVAEGSHAKHHPEVRTKWADLLGQRALWLTDHTKVAELIVSTLEVVAGDHDADSVAKTWDGSTAVVVRGALGTLTKASASKDIVTL
jgi:hypothetical protein